MPEISSFARIGHKNAEGKFVPDNLRAQDVYATTGASAEEHITDAGKHLTAEQAEKIAGSVQAAEKGAANGVAALDADGKLPVSQIPTAVTGGMSYQGTFDPATGMDGKGGAIPASAAANKGHYWVASAEGEFTPPGASAPLQFAARDWLVSNGAGYNEIDNTTADAAARQAAAAAQSKAESAETAANLLDAAYCVSEADMASKNLRAGAFVLMEVANTL